jgi:ABC-type phosphate transport system substrate-binding protein
MHAILKLLLTFALWLPFAAVQANDAGLVLIAHPGVPKVDATTLQRLYTGRAIEVAGTPVTVVNAAAGSPVRDRFLAAVLNMDNERYTAYWTVRRHVGKGVPPRDMRSAAEVIEFVQSTPGAIGYVPTADAKPGLNVVFKP